WVIEVGEYGLLYMSFLGAAWVLRREGHVKMDLVLNRLKLRSQVLLNVITSILGAIVFLIVTWYSAHFTWDLFQLGYIVDAYLDPPKWPIMAIIPVGSFLFSIQFLRRSYGYLRNWRASSNKEQRSP
ncbi:TRAP transporter small permease, partial [Chloroflexota bacterium]